MRIVHVVQSLGMGGQERLILDYSRELARRGHEPIIATMSPGGALRPEFDPIPVVDIPKSDGFDPLAIGRIAKKLSELSPDVIHTHNPPPLLYVVPAARLLRQRRIVHTKHGRNIYGRNSLRLA
ncbi:MAG: glycosyltransferase, partial [Polyangiaceae bacterium]|nr:glycosyltransferase [Polyangiaceae bacterium]